MLSDIEIAQQAKMQKITDVGAKLGISEDDIELYGKAVLRFNPPCQREKRR